MAQWCHAAPNNRQYPIIITRATRNKLRFTFKWMGGNGGGNQQWTKLLDDLCVWIVAFIILLLGVLLVILLMFSPNKTDDFSDIIFSLRELHMNCTVMIKTDHVCEYKDASSHPLEAYEVMSLKAVPRVDGSGEVCGLTFKVDGDSRTGKTGMPRVGSDANWSQYYS